MYRTQAIQEEVKDNLMNNRMFFEITHKEFTKQNLKEDVNLEYLWSVLPQNYSKFFTNKTVLKNKEKIMDLYSRQRSVATAARNKRKVRGIKMTCIEECDIDEGLALREKEKAKLRKLEEDLQPDMMEQIKLKQEMDHELKNNKICNLSDAIETVEQKHKKRMRYMANNIKKRRLQGREDLKKYMREKAKAMAMLEMDDE